MGEGQARDQEPREPDWIDPAVIAMGEKVLADESACELTDAFGSCWFHCPRIIREVH